MSAEVPAAEPRVGTYIVPGPALPPPVPEPPVQEPEQPPAPRLPGPESFCGHDACWERPAVHWSRRLTQAEIDAVPAELRTDDMRALVYACAVHAIGMEDAALIHAPECTAPRAEHLPGCDCTPVPEPQPPARPVTTLPTGWQITT